MAAECATAKTRRRYVTGVASYRQRVCVCMLNAAVTRPYVVRCARVQVTWTAITIRPERVRLRTGKSFGAVYPVVAGRNVL